MSDKTIGVSIITNDEGFEQLKKLAVQLTEFDQVVIAHNGKDKKVREYFRQLGKPFEYYRFDWRPTPENYGRNDWGFSYARNFSFSKLKTEYALWLDTDDLIGQVKNGREFIASSKQAYGAFKKIVTEAPDDTDCWLATYVYSRDDYGNPNTMLSRERIVKLDLGWKWIYPIHEVLAPVRRPKHAVITDVQAIHNPPIKEETSIDRNARMLWDWYDQLLKDEDPIVRHDLIRCRWYIGAHLYAAHDYKKAAHWAVKEFLANHPEALTIEKYQAWVITGKCQIELENPEAAKAAALAAIDMEPGLSDGYILLAQAKFMLEDDPQDILIVLDHAGNAEEPPPEVIQNPMDYTFTPRCLVSECKYKLGQWDAALEWALKAGEAMPGDPRVEELRVKAAARVRERDAVEAAKALYKIYLDYDENQKAAELYSILPYVAQRDDEVVKAAELAVKRIRHLQDREEYAKVYTENSHWAPAPEEMVLEKRPPGEQRMRYILDRLKKALPNGGRILDVGCSDGFHSLVYAQEGYEVVGVDLDERCVGVANERAIKWNLPAKFIHGFFEEMHPERLADPFDNTRPWFHNFDAVICSEVIEHVSDPAYLIGCLGDCAKDGAPIIITTPNEAFDQGDTPQGGGMYEEDKDIAGHVRVYTQQSFEQLLKGLAAEFHVVESHYVPFEYAYRENQGWQVGEIRRMPHPDGPVIRIWCGDQVAFNPDDLNTKGVGGSETAVVHMAKHWSELGCQVVVYGSDNGIWDGVFYRTANNFSPEHKSDVFISWRDPGVFALGRPDAKLTVLWCHDLMYPTRERGLPENQYPDEWVDRIDRIVVLSKFHEDFITKAHLNFAGKTWVSRNGIDPSRYLNRDVEKVPHRYFYSSSYDRGLKELLEVWPQIKDEIPDAELHVCYGTEVAVKLYKELKDYKRLDQLNKTLEKLQATDGVIHHERLGQQELADLQLSCEAWLYPPQDDPNGGWLETYGITAVEAQAARAFPVSRSNGALPEVLKHKATWEKLTDVIPLLNYIDSHSDDLKQNLDENQEWALSQTWESLSKEWLVELQPKEAELVAAG